jgi:hypothetical protein
MEKSFIRNKVGVVALLLAMPVLASDPSIVEIISSTVEVPAHDYRAFSSQIKNWPAVFHCTFEVATGPPVQVTLLARPQLNDFARGRHYESLVEMTPRPSGKFSQVLPEKGDYDILLVNDADAPAMVRLHGAVQYAREPDVAVYLSPMRKIVVIALSLLIFGISFGWSASKVVGAMRR